MSLTETKFKRRIVMSGMIAVIAVSMVTAKFMGSRANTLVVCLWDLIFLSNGLLATIRPAQWLYLMGSAVTEPIKIMVRCVGVFAILVGAALAINLAVNLSDYWNGVY